MLGLTLATALATSVPFTLSDHRVFVRTFIGRAGPFSMVVDTGSSNLVITPEVARRIRVTGKGSVPMTGAGAGHVVSQQVTVSGLRLGDMQFPAAQALVGDLSAIRRGIGFKQLDGIIGYDQLRRLTVFFDIDDRRLTLTSATFRLPSDTTTTTFTLDGELPFVPAAVDGVHGTFLIDTGDRSQLTLFRPFAQTNDFFHFATVRNVLTGYGVGGPLYADLLRTTLQAFGTTAPDVATRLPLAAAGAFNSPDYAGSIGYGFLERFNVAFDYPHLRMFTWPAKRAPEETSLLRIPAIPPVPTEPLARHGLFGAAATRKPAGVTLTVVSPGGPAAVAGLQAGDVIRRIGTQTIATAADYYRAVHDASAGRPIDVVYARNDAARQVSVTLGTAANEADPDVKTLYQAIAVDNSLRRAIVTLPQNAAQKLPAVLFVGGIGCFSVDVAASKQDAYMRLAHDLSRAGYVAMRVEKSGLGDSQGPPCFSVDLEAERRAYEAALTALASNPLVDPQRIFVFGHSIGTVIAPRLPATHPVAGIIVAEAVGRDWPEYEVRNARRELELAGESPASVDKGLIEKAQCMQKLLFDDEPEAQIEATMPSCADHNSVYPVTPWYVRQAARLNVIEPWSQIKVPVLAIYGTSDFVTEVADHQRIVDVVNGAHPGSASLATIDAMSHLLGMAATPRIASNDYDKGVAETYDDTLSATIVAWLTKVSTASQSLP